jgi:hypothetical protein
MEQRIRGHFSEAQCLVVILEKPAAFVVKMAKISCLLPSVGCREPSNGLLTGIIAQLLFSFNFFGIKFKKGDIIALPI